MAIFEITKHAIIAAQPTTLATHGLKERDDLQRLLRSSIDLIDPDVMVLTEEFCEWEDSKRRIDLLGLDRDAKLVIVELKRTEDGGHMELQAIRYAAMVSSITFRQAVATHAEFLKKLGTPADASALILEFLGWDEPHEEAFGQDVRIVLVSADFSKELTTSVIWLNERNLDVRCVRLRPYVLEGRVLLDVQQILPLPEAADYQIKMKQKSLQRRVGVSGKREKYDLVLNGTAYPELSKRWLMYHVVRACIAANVSPEEIAKDLPKGSTRWLSVDGSVDGETFRNMIIQPASNGATLDLKLYFVEDDELVRYNGRTYALSNQWGMKTIATVEKLLGLYPEVKGRWNIAEGAGG